MPILRFLDSSYVLEIFVVLPLASSQQVCKPPAPSVNDDSRLQVIYTRWYTPPEAVVSAGRRMQTYHQGFDVTGSLGTDPK